MTHLDFRGIDRTGQTKAQIVAQAQRLQRDMATQFPGFTFPLQEAIDSTIDAWVEHQQG